MIKGTAELWGGLYVVNSSGSSKFLIEANSSTTTAKGVMEFHEDLVVVDSDGSDLLRLDRSASTGDASLILHDSIIKMDVTGGGNNVAPSDPGGLGGGTFLYWKIQYGGNDYYVQLIPT